MKIFVGFDPREGLAYRACVESLREHRRASEIWPIGMSLLGDLYTRPTTKRDGKLWDEISDAPMSTEFSLARFLVPTLAKSGWALFCDGDFLWRSDVADLFALADDRYSVMVVKHDHRAAPGLKMDGQIQTGYPRKNWSSLILWNCDRFDGDWANYCNSASGLALHQFKFLRDEDIGEIPLEWNWLVDVSPPIANPRAVHFTLGTPDMLDVVPSYADEWWKYAKR